MPVEVTHLHATLRAHREQRGTNIGHGFAPADSGIGSLISFSTQPGNVALDGTGRNSPYSGALVKKSSCQAKIFLRF
jgi:uncharacterized caspase-like protein